MLEQELLKLYGEKVYLVSGECSRIDLISFIPSTLYSR